MALIILAGGKSSRMGGGDKAFLPFGEETMVGLIIGQMSRIFADVIVVARNPEAYAELPVRVVSDRYTGLGPIGGVHAGLLASSDEYNFVLACDLPLMKVELVQYLLAQAGKNPGIDLVIPSFGGFIEPTAAVYGRRILPVVEEFIQRKDYKLKNMIAVLRTEYVSEAELRRIDPELESFYNVNTPEEYLKVLQIIRGNDQ